MTPEQLDQIIKEAPDDIRERLGELAPKIREAAIAKLEDSQENEKSAVLNVAVSIKIDLACSPVAWDVEAVVGARYKSKGPEHVADTSPDLGMQIEKGRRPKP